MPKLGPLIIVIACAHGAAAGAKENESAESLVPSGRAIYQQYCASCHGSHAEGAPQWQSRNDQGDLPPPPHDANGHTWRHSDAMLEEMISKGLRDPFNKTADKTMPAFEKLLSPDQVQAVIAYFKTLWTPQERQFQLEENRRQAPSSHL